MTPSQSDYNHYAEFGYWPWDELEDLDSMTEEEYLGYAPGDQD